MGDFIPNKCVLRKLTDTYCRHLSHVNFLETCIKEDLFPNGMRVRYGTSALPDSPYLRFMVNDILKNATSNIILQCKATYTLLSNSFKLKLDSFLYNVFQNASYFTYESTLNLYHSLFSAFQEKYRRTKQAKLWKLRASYTRCAETTTTEEARTNVSVPVESHSSSDRDVSDSVNSSLQGLHGFPEVTLPYGARTENESCIDRDVSGADCASIFSSCSDTFLKSVVCVRMCLKRV